MNRNLRMTPLLLIALAFLGTACEPASTGDDDSSGSSSKTVTASGEYRVNTFQIATESSDELDIDGDTKGDNNLNNALQELVDFIVDYITNYVELPGSVEITIKQILNGILSVDTINASLVDQLEAEIWLTRLQPPEEASVTVDSNAVVDFGLGYQEDLGSTDYFLDYTYGELDGTYDDESLLVDTWGELELIINLSYLTYSYPFSFTLQQARDYHVYNEDALDAAQLAGAISTSYLEALVDLIFVYAEEAVPGLDLSELKTEVHTFLEDDDVSDITLEDGSKAISVSFVYNATGGITIEDY